MPRASRICASTKWPIRHFAITGIVTAAMIDLISSGSDMRATPPSLRISAGTRSSAITAQAPASWAIRACSAVTTSMITPPFSICASPALTLKEPFTDPFPLRTPLRSATLEILRGRVGIAAPAHPPPPRIVRTIRPASAKLEARQAQRSLGGVLVVGRQAVALKLDPFDGGQRDPGRLVVLQATGVVHLDEEVRLVEIEIAGHPFDGLVVEEAHDYPGHFIPTVLTPIWQHSCAGL